MRYRDKGWFALVRLLLFFNLCNLTQAFKWWMLPLLPQLSRRYSIATQNCISRTSFPTSTLFDLNSLILHASFCHGNYALCWKHTEPRLSLVTNKTKRKKNKKHQDQDQHQAQQVVLSLCGQTLCSICNSSQSNRDKVVDHRQLYKYWSQTNAFTFACVTQCSTD